MVDNVHPMIIIHLACTRFPKIDGMNGILFLILIPFHIKWMWQGNLDTKHGEGKSQSQKDLFIILLSITEILFLFQNIL